MPIADGDRHRMLGNEVVEHDGRIEAQAIQTHIDARWFVATVVGGHINRDGPRTCRGRFWNRSSSKVKVFPAATELWTCESGPKG